MEALGDVFLNAHAAGTLSPPTEAMRPTFISPRPAPRRRAARPRRQEQIVRPALEHGLVLSRLWEPWVFVAVSDAVALARNRFG